MIDVLAFPVGGLHGKTRLSLEKGGFFTLKQRQNLSKALILDVINAARISNIFREVFLCVPSSETDLLEFCSINSIKVKSLSQVGFNNQLKEIQSLFGESNSLLIQAADLPLVSPSFYSKFEDLWNEFINKHGKGIMINYSRYLGSATICLSPPNIHQISLDHCQYNLITNLVEAQSKDIIIEIKYLFEGICDIDNPKDLLELYNLLLINETQSNTLDFLKREKWSFLLPNEEDRRNIVETWGEIYGSTEEEIIEIISRGIQYVKNCMVMSLRTESRITIYVTSIELGLDLSYSLRPPISENSTLAFEALKIQNTIISGNNCSVFIAGYGAYCSDLTKEYLKQTKNG